VLLFQSAAAGVGGTYQASTRSDSSGHYSFTVSNNTTPYFVVCINALIGDSALVGWWRFGEGSGTTAYDSSGNGNNGTLEGSPPPSWVTGGGALSFTAANNDYVDVPDNASLQVEGNAFSISLWVSIANVNQAFFINKMNSAETKGYRFFLWGGTMLDLYKGGGHDQKVSWTPSLNTWYHIVVVQLYSGGEPSQALFYVNGSLLGTINDTNAYGNSSGVDLLIGATNSAYDSGSIKDVRIYNRALSASKVATLYSNPPAVVGTSDNNLFGS
jgi:hypothetical protein